MEEDDFDDLFGSINSPEDSDVKSANLSPPTDAAGASNQCTFAADWGDSAMFDVEEDGPERLRVAPGHDVSPALPAKADEDPGCISISLCDAKVHTDSHDNVLSKVEAVFEEIADALLNERDQAGIMLKRRPKMSARVALNADQPDKQALRNDGRRICFPGRTEREAWQFAVLTRLLALIHQALREGTVLSKRDIYYRDPALFGKQEVVDRYIDDIAFTFGVTRSSLSVTAAAKGLIAGAVTFCKRDGTSTNAGSDREGVLVPSPQDILSVDMSSARWILVIEKEATFRSLIASTFWISACTTGIFITAKGYPDIATRAILRLLCSPSPLNGFAAPAVYGLVDFDPDGLAILSTYKHGSNSLAHEYGELKVVQMQWLGLRSEHVTTQCSSTQTGQGLLSLSTRDRTKAQKMLDWPALGSDGEARMELQRMLMLNVKAELQLLDTMPGAMNDLLTDALLSREDF